jgi:formylmethanofuran dehydrogenase subunit E
LPHKHPNVRYQERIKGSNERKLYYRVCEKCGENMLSVYDEHSSGKIYCETCYNKELY